MDDILNKLTKSINEMTAEDFEQLPVRGWMDEIGEFDALVIIPGEDIHCSGYRCMAFVACFRDFAVCKISGGSDVIHVDGIGGFGEHGILKFFNNNNQQPPNLPLAWCLDCLKVSGYLRLFVGGVNWGLKAGVALSSFDLYSVPPSPDL